MAKFRAIVLSVLAVSAVAGGAVWYEQSAPATGAPAAGATASARPAPAVPVLAGVAARADVPIYLSGLGTVQAFNTVTVRARVDGQLDKIGFVEGQDVKTGDLLAQLDPRPLQAALNQAV